MNSPLVLIARRLPRELVHIIQTYIRNDIVHEAVRNHLHYLMHEQEMYMRFVYYNYIEPLCTCHQHGPKYMRKYGGCQNCMFFESIQYSDSEYKVAGYVTCLGGRQPTTIQITKK